MIRELIDEYSEYWRDLTVEIVNSENMRSLQMNIDELYAELDPNGTWTTDDLVDTFRVWVEYTKELLRRGCDPEKLRNEVYQCCMHATM